jgi:hypothetical protein
MPTAEVLPFASVIHEAEHELGAFLRAVTDIVGLGGLPQVGDLWIRTMEDAGCPGSDLKRFFRGVIVRAVAQLAKSSGSVRRAPGAWAMAFAMA